MEGYNAKDLFQAQSHLCKHVFNFISSMSLKCVVELGIPDIINNHGQPITLPDLVTALQIQPAKAGYVHRLMLLMVHSGFFATKQVSKDRTDYEEGELAYDLTPSSRLLLKDDSPSLSAFVLGMLDPALATQWQFLGKWLKGNYEHMCTAFQAAHGVLIWEYAKQNPEFNNIFNEAMVSDSSMLKLVIKDCKSVFDGLSSVVDVAGGTGEMARMLCEAFPHLNCTVLELPHVVANLPDTENLKFIGGDMFQAIPKADAILLKATLHNLNDEDSVKLLKKCREANPGNGQGKVIVIEIVIDVAKDKHEVTDAKLYVDLLMLASVTGKERSEKAWKKLFLEAGFSSYKITSIFGLKSLIEVFP